MFWELFIIILIVLLADYLAKRKVNIILKNIPGPRNLPIIGSVLMYYDIRPDDLLKLTHRITAGYGRVAKFWVFHIKALVISDAKYIQAILNNPTEIKKNSIYLLLRRWLGEGLLLSYGPKWFARRRILTPAFHFQILENFIPIFDQQAVILAGKLKRHSLENGKNLNAITENPHQYVIDIEDYVALATLDVICETAMRVKINAQTNKQSQYVQNLIEMQNILLRRFVANWYRPSKLFKIMNPKLYGRYKEVMQSLHNFTNNIILERRKEMRRAADPGRCPNVDGNVDKSYEAQIYGSKQRLTFLDVLLSSTIDGKPLSDAEVREEVDTFMFEGHDTTKSGIGFTLYALSREPVVQQKLYEEVREIAGLDLEEPLKYATLMNLKYMEKVIKESLRMYPPVPFYGRHIVQDMHIGDQCIPAGTNVLLAIMTMQNDALYFDEPQRFNPDRDMGDKGYIFLPFSAGPRNCIGQRFAMLEMKTFLVRIIQNYELLPLGEEIQPIINIVLKSKTGWQMGFRNRK